MYDWSICFSKLPCEIQEMINNFSIKNERKTHETQYCKVMEELKYKHFISFYYLIKYSDLFYHEFLDYTYFYRESNYILYKSNIDGRYYYLYNYNWNPDFPTQMKLISK